jgi:shikimate dehydrogenase
MSDHPRIPIAGVIGSPIAHSRSPALFRHWFQQYGVVGHYVPLDVAAGDLETVLRTLPKAGFVGVNVTIPHKIRALEIADVISDRAALIGAANTLIFRSDGKIHADNTDGYGFIANLKQYAPGWTANAGSAAVLGAGGAARAIVASLLETGAPEIRISNRTRARADALRAEFGARIVVYDWVQAGNMIEGATTVVNTTSLGMTGKQEFRVPLDALSPGTTCCDLVYSPLRTKFLIAAEEAGCVAVDGLGMLLHQAVPGFERWFGQRPQVTDSLRDAVLNA